MQPRAKGVLRLDVKPANGGSAIARLEQSGASRILFSRADDVEGILINTAGGITGGDRFRSDIQVAAHASATLTTQASERLYRAVDGSEGRIETTIRVHNDAMLAWLPQETILFQGADIRRRFSAKLAATSRMLFVEPLVFGRMAMGEKITNARFWDSVSLQIDDQIAFRDTTHLTGNIAQQLDRPAVGHGARAAALLLYAGPDAETHLSGLRKLNVPVSLVRENLLVMRLLAADGYDLRRILVPVLSHFTPLPRSWSL